MLALVAIAAAILLTAGIVQRHAVGRVVVSSLLSLTTGYRVDFGEMRLQSDHGAFLNTHVSRHGEPVLDAARIDVYYHLRDLLPGSSHRFGFLGLTIDHPKLTIIHHKDGSYNIGAFGGLGKPSPGVAPALPTRANGTPLNFEARVRDGSATLLDDYQFYKEARVQTIHHLNVNLAFNSAARTHYILNGAFVDTKDEPLHAVGTIDYTRGFAMHHITASALPIKAIGNYIINSPAARIVAGTARAFDARIYALDVRPDAPIDYHISGLFHLNDGQLYVHGLAKPIDNLSGPLQITDANLAARRLDATIAGMRIVVAGAIYDFSDPKFYLGVQGADQLRDLKSVIPVGSRLALTGSARVRTLIEGPIANPLILVGFDAPQVNFDVFPLRDAHGTVALYDNVATVANLQGHYGGVTVSARGDVSLGSKIGSQIALGFSGNANDLPYLGALAPGSEMAGTAIVRGTGTALGVSGYLADPNDISRISTLFSVSPEGVGSIGPIAVRRNGGTLVAQYALNRRTGDSAFWLSARDFELAAARPVTFSGLELPQFPQLAGHVLSADLAGAGSGRDASVAGNAHARDLSVAGTRVDDLGVRFAGPLGALAISHVDARGPWGTFAGNASYADGALAARGDFNGSLEGLPMAVAAGARGGVHGPVALAYRDNTVILQTQGTRLDNVSVRGIPVQSLEGTLAFANGGVTIYAARGEVAGATAAASGSLGNGIAFTTADAGPQTFRALGLPLQAGRVAAVGTFRQSGGTQTFDGGVAVTDGMANGMPLQGSSELHLRADNSLAVNDATVIAKGMYGAVNGTIGNVRSGRPDYALQTVVPAGDLLTAAQMLHKPTYGTVGSFAANLQIGGSGAAPTAAGVLRVPAGQVNGLDFENARASVNAGASSIAVRDGSVQVGSTNATFAARASAASSAVSVRAPRADLFDFNNFFDTGDTLAGRGSVAFSVAHDANRIASAGDVNVRDFRYRRLPIGDTQAHWTSQNGIVRESLRVGGVHGLLGVTGSIGLAAGPTLADIVARSRYDVSAHLRGLDLTTWLPAFGYPTVPMTGRLDSDARLDGRYPSLSFSTEAKLLQGTIGRVPIELLHVIARSNGSLVDVTHLDVQVPAVLASGSGSFGIGARAPVAFTLNMQSNDLPKLSTNFVKTPLNVHGNLQTEIKLAGTWSAPRLTAGVDLTNGNISGVIVPQLVASLALRGSDIEVRNAEVSFAKGKLAIAGALPLQLSPLGIGPSNAPFSMDLFSNGVDLSSLNPVLPNATKLGGILNGHVGVNGTVGAPSLRGSLAVSGGSYVSALETTPLTQTVAQMVFSGTSATLRSLHGMAGRGTLDASGQIAFARGAAGSSGVSYVADILTRGAQLHFPAYGSGTVDSKMRLSKTAGAQLAMLSGTVAVTNATIPFAALIPQGGSSASGGSAAPALPFNLAFNLGVTAGKNVAVRASALGFGIDIGAKGHVLLAGTLAQPTLDGAFSAAGGSLTFVDHVFKVQQGTVTFNPANGVVPELYAVGTTHVNGIETSQTPTGGADITIKVSGAATNPQLSFSSDPPGLSRDQIIAMLTPFGAISGLQFDESGNPVAPGQLAGAPPPGNAQPIPAGAVRRTNGTLSVGAEAFNILNAQFARSLLAPIENALGGSLGLSSVNLTLDYNGTVGVSVRRPISDRLSAVYASTFGFPMRQTYGFQYAPNEYTVAQLTFFEQQTPATFFGNGASTITTDPAVTAGQPISGQNGFTFSLQRLFW